MSDAESYLRIRKMRLPLVVSTTQTGYIQLSMPSYLAHLPIMFLEPGQTNFTWPAETLLTDFNVEHDQKSLQIFYNGNLVGEYGDYVTINRFSQNDNKVVACTPIGWNVKMDYEPIRLNYHGGFLWNFRFYLLPILDASLADVHLQQLEISKPPEILIDPKDRPIIHYEPSSKNFFKKISIQTKKRALYGDIVPSGGLDLSSFHLLTTNWKLGPTMCNSKLLSFAGFHHTIAGPTKLGAFLTASGNLICCPVKND